MIFTDLERMYYKVNRGILKWTFVKKILLKVCVNEIVDMYERSTKVKILYKKN